MRASTLVLAAVVGVALAGLAADGNWPKVVRVATAALTYAAVLEAFVRGLGRDRVRAGGLPFPAFAVAALHAGLVSGLLRPVVEAHIVVAGALAAGVLLGGIHWLALRQWRRLRAVVGGAPQPGR